MTGSTLDLESLNRRLQKLEDIEAIRKLKARYLNACDQHVPAEVRACFADGKVPIIVGHLGSYDTADGFVAMYKQAACHDYVLEAHHGANGEIDIVDDTHAKGLWGLSWRCVNSKDKTLTFVSLQYHDEYVKVDGKWKISATRSDFKSAFHATYEGEAMAALVAGVTVADPPLRKG
ncbi:MAG TPA: nuclear transport factor 2 family protein [Alphaproteobacteria bacterium]|nr:nuclear transport factor 2 family protein [Alphaproteobacteria bacterium]